MARPIISKVTVKTRMTGSDTLVTFSTDPPPHNVEQTDLISLSFAGLVFPSNGYLQYEGTGPGNTIGFCTPEVNESTKADTVDVTLRRGSNTVYYYNDVPLEEC